MKEDDEYYKIKTCYCYNEHDILKKGYYEYRIGYDSVDPYLYGANRIYGYEVFVYPEKNNGYSAGYNEEEFNKYFTTDINQYRKLKLNDINTKTINENTRELLAILNPTFKNKNK